VPLLFGQRVPACEPVHRIDMVNCDGRNRRILAQMLSGEIVQPCANGGGAGGVGSRGDRQIEDGHANLLQCEALTINHPDCSKNRIVQH
jgi:hypothetical protein